VRDLARRGYPERCPAVFSATGWYHEEVFKVWAALAAERGARLLGTQHGGNYGIEAVNTSEDFELSIVDRYYTWGWRREDVATPTEVMPATRLTSGAWRAVPEPRGVLFVATVASRYGLRVDAWSRAYLEWQDRFAAALDPETGRALRVRLHRDDGGWDMAERWADRAPDVRIEGWDVPFTQSIASARVVVCDHLSTTYAQALAAGRPTVLFWDPATERMREEARPVFEGLRRAGVLLDTPEDAARTVVAVLADPDGWMADERRRAAISRFVERFAVNTPDAERRWAREFRELAR
jgi:putative transferase (TIGR04331 family)